MFNAERQRRNERGTRKLEHGDRNPEERRGKPSPQPIDPYDPSHIETKWQQRWAASDIYRVDLDAATDPHYNLTEFPYPSAEGLHMGHVSTYGGADAYGRMMRMRGKDVFQPMGWDAFGIHSENYALQNETHPAVVVPRNIARFRRQMQRIGAAFDWSREVDTTSPRYYRWTQWILCRLLEGGLVYKAERAVSWCPSCMTTLADEQVIGGKCERCNTVVIQREMPQWFLRITDYADQLLQFEADYPETTRTLQRNWIGRSEGARITFEIAGRDEKVEVFTTRADTLYGVTFLVLGPEHPLAMSIAEPSRRAQVEAFCNAIRNTPAVDRQANRSREGVATGAVAINPINADRLPVYVAAYVLGDVGTGAIFGAPAHDTRDHTFALEHGLPIVSVVGYGSGQAVDCSNLAHDGPGVLVGSGPYTGLSTDAARQAMVNDLASRGLAKPAVTYRLHDWNISRQRYWGPPIPFVTCDRCGVLPVPDRELPVLLPETDNYRPMGDGRSPLALVPGFTKTCCPKCGGPAARETDVSDNFVDSAWYFIRYLSPDLDEAPWRTDRLPQWLPVSLYFGGQEHSTLHHLYARFLWKALQDLGHLPRELGPEPFARLRLHGLVIKDGHKMSKSRGNVIDPDDYVERYGADAVRLYLLFMAPFSRGGDFRDDGINGMTRFLAKAWRLGAPGGPAHGEDPADELVRARHRAVRVVQRDMEALAFNTAIAELMSYLSAIQAYRGRASREVWEDAWSAFVRLLAPLAPHITEELWESAGGAFSVHTQAWPAYDPALAEPERVVLAIQVDGKLRAKIEIERGTAEQQARKMALEMEKVQNAIAGRRVCRAIFVPDRVLNLVTVSD